MAASSTNTVDVSECEAVIHRSEEDDAFIAVVPELAECMADGPTKAEALANAKVVVRQWIETAETAGLPIPKPRARKVA